MAKKIKSYLYTQGKFGKRIRETLDTNNKFLYSHGRYPTKITREDLPENYVQIHSRAVWYMIGYIKTSGVVDIEYSYCKENHLFKDDYIYLSYRKKIKQKIDRFGFADYIDYDACVCGNDIVNIVLAVEKYSSIDTTNVRKKIEEKRIWLRDNEPDYYKLYGLEDRDIFTQFIENGYIDKRILK